MKKNDLNDLKTIDIKALKERSAKIKLEIVDLMLDRNVGKLKDVRMVSKKRRDLAQILTVLRQKELLAQMESLVNQNNEKGEMK